MDLTKCTVVGDYKISNTCLQSYPCKHYVQLKNGESKVMSGHDIYRMFASEGLHYPHIDNYAAFVRRADFPTPEELEEDRQQKITSELAYLKQLKETEEKQKEIHMYKASSRIDKLKAANSIS
jgi:hypothetical protein